MSEQTVSTVDTVSDGNLEQSSEDRAAQIAAAAGVGIDQVGKHRLEISKITRNGVLVKVSVTGSSIFTRRATFGELGIADSDVRRMHYTAGSKYIFPRELAGRFRSIENRARDAVAQYAHVLPGFGDWRWLAFTAIPGLRDRILQLQAERDILVDEMKRDYPFYIEALESEFESSARAAWRSIVGQGFDAVRVNGVVYTSEQDFVGVIISKILARVPSIEDIENKLRVSYQVQQVVAAADVAQDSLKAAELQEQEENLRAAYRRQRDQEYLTVQAQRDEMMHERTLRQIEADEREQIARAAITAELERARQEMAETSSYVDAIFQSIREKLANGAREMLESVQTNGFLKGKIAERGTGLLDLYNTLGGCITNDRELESTLRKLRNEIGPIGDSRDRKAPARDVQSITETLSHIVELAENELSDLTETSRAEFIEF